MPEFSHIGHQPVDAEHWAVSLVKAAGPFSHHAQIVVEGIDPANGSKFFKFAHFAGPHSSRDSCRPNLVPAGFIGYRERGIVKPFRSIDHEMFHHDPIRTWLRPRTLLIQMMENIDAQAHQNPEHQPAFHICGKNSIFNSKPYVLYDEISKLIPRDPWDLLPGVRLYRSIKKVLSYEIGHNCFTWAKEKLQIAGITLADSFSSYFIAAPHGEEDQDEEAAAAPIH